jgi:hypothetical protein
MKTIIQSSLLITIILVIVSCKSPTSDVEDVPFGTIIVDVTNPATGQTWMDRNLGASRVATSIDDVESFGDMYQWGRGTDGHQLRWSSTNPTLSNSEVPGHGEFIINTDFSLDWLTPQNNNLWQGVNGVNNPLSDRIPPANRDRTRS